VNLTASVTTLPGVGTSFAGKLSRLGVATIFDLLYHLPFRYEDRSLVSPVATVQPGATVTVKGTITAIKNEYTRSGRFIQKATLSDATGSLDVIWFNQLFLVKALRNQQVALYGKIDFFSRQVAMISPDYELLTTGYKPLHTCRIVPIYPETAGVSSKWLRAKIFPLLQALPDTDPWPASNMPPWKDSLSRIHFPNNLPPRLGGRTKEGGIDLDNYKQRLAFDELFLLQTKSLSLRQNWQDVRLAHPFTVNQTQILEFIANLPFTLTSSQNQAIRDILSDLSTPRPMNRLLEGDVGSGKTVVAAIGAYVAYLNNFQSVLMAPTQILAAQHYQTLTALFKPYGIKVDLVTANTKNSQLSIRSSQLVVGTHALLSGKNQVIFKNVGLVIIDEQHRFGVIQRSLAAELGASPHILTMTATPIPRSVALTMFGELDLSQLTEKPVGRTPVKTWVVPESKRTSAYTWIRSQISDLKSQAFVICPFITASESAATVKAVTAEYTKLTAIFSDLHLGLLHGKLTAKAKDQVINAFRAGEYHILVTTPIVEVGIDIPSATIIVIEGAERFGLAQLHQLRGRVGRSHAASYCLLFTSAGSPPQRLKALETLDSGIKLAELDLKYRGPGEIYGTAQHGFPEFKIAGYDNLDLIEKARTAAQQILPALTQYPVLRDLLKNDKITLIQPN
jgi:ATP-dependent DNA helicase RecG